MPLNSDAIHYSGRGDLASQEKGSGARADSGKPNWALMPLAQVCYLLNRDLVTTYDRSVTITLSSLVDHAAMVQMYGDYQSILNLLKWSMAYLVEFYEGDVVRAFEEVIRIWEHGEKKYAAFNWMKGMSWSAVLACYMRHIMCLYKNETIDQESGRHHGGHLICNAMMLVHYFDYYPEGNDLPIRWYKETNHEQDNHSPRS